MKKFTKNILKEFKYSFGRFFAIMAIVAVGVGFLIGVMQATPDMKRSMDHYYRENSAYDASVKATLGLSEEDVAAIADLDNVEKVTPVISTDCMASIGDGTSVAVKLVGTDFSEDALNQITVLEGRLPQTANEIVVERSNKYFSKIEIGEKIAIKEYGSYGDIYETEEFEVVGIVSTPDYYGKESREVTSIGAGYLSGVFYVLPEVYKMDGGIFQRLEALGVKPSYTDCYILFEESEEYQTFTDDYKNYVLDSLTSVRELGTKRNSSLNETLAPFNVQAEWYLLDRASTNVSYISFALNVEKVEDIAGVFPVFFIVVAALVALTSMTRMVEEDRMQIGTFKALGYGGGKIMSKYLLYCCFASFVGCVGGILIGFSLLPSIFWRAYETLYFLPKLSLLFSPWFALAVFGIALLGTALVTVYACRSAVKEKPSVLMQPKAPKPGKRILLERVGFFWNILKFKWKATIRNIFRYKKNMILTIISVMGCTALILTGFGMNDSVQAVTSIQFKDIVHYDTVIGYSGEREEGGALDTFLADSDWVSLYSESGNLIFGSGKNQSFESVDLFLVENESEFSSFVTLREYGKTSQIKISDKGVSEDNSVPIVLTENLAVVYDVNVGDTVLYRSGDQEITLKVYKICENYTGSYVYMGKDAYQSVTGKTVEENTYLVKAGVKSGDISELAEKLLGDKSVTSVEFTQTTIDTFKGLDSTMGMIIAVLVISAGALAAIVLYNLTNINIDERRREIATLRVLGYKKSEVAGYIYRESAILTVFGTLLGLVLGFFLHMYIVRRVNGVMMMFGRTISWMSYIWSFLLTLAFAVIVYAFMLIKLNKINMAESLKSNE